MSDSGRRKKISRQHTQRLESESEDTLETSPNGKFYKLSRVIGQGSFKIVHRGLNTSTGVPVAWCELHSHYVTSEARKTFLEEALLLKELEHPNILRLFDCWETKQHGSELSRVNSFFFK